MMESSIKNFQDLYRKHGSEDATTQLLDLWHYTSADGLTGIIRDQLCEHKKLHFWFTRSDCLNDTSEGTHILSLFRQVCSELFENGVISKSFYNLIKDAEIPDYQFMNFPVPPRKGFTREIALDIAPCHAYICSFSLKEDSLDMWRYYSKGNGGYGLKCISILFDDYKRYENSDYDENALFCYLRSYKVIYNEKEKEQILKSIIIDTFSAYLNSDESEKSKRRQAKEFVQYTLKILQFQFKHECYSSEQEYRFVVYIPYEKPLLLKNKLPDVQFRKQNGMLVPYIDLTVENGADYLKEVLISPFIESESVLNTTSDYVSQCGFNCSVRLSQLPVRK